MTTKNETTTEGGDGGHCQQRFVLHIEMDLIDPDMLIDKETLDSEFNGSLLEHVRWCLKKEGADLSLFDIVDDYKEPRIVAIRKYPIENAVSE